MAQAFTRVAALGLLSVGCAADDSDRAEDGGVGGGIGALTSGTGIETPQDGSDDALEPKLDVPDSDDGPGNGGDCNNGGGGGTDGDVEFTYIWIANSPEGTVSKIDTRTETELARYYTGASNGNDDPSRTAVNLAGDVAVTNRAGGIAKFAADEERCVDRNNNGEIETSTGPADVLPFGQDECWLWSAPLPGGNGLDNIEGPRPTAWDAGIDAADPCATSDDRVWVGWWEQAADRGQFRRLSGVDGSTVDEVTVDSWSNGALAARGPYGGAVDSDNDLWVTGLFDTLVRIDGESLAVSRWSFPAEAQPYGIALDANGHVWTAGYTGTVTHFDPTTEQFNTIPAGGVLRGIMVDRDGFAWAAKNDPCGLVQVDTATNTLIDASIALPGCSVPVGVSIDIDGFVWVPDRGASLTYKLDTADYSTVTVTGLVEPYTYSDMTGAGLGLVFNPPQG